MATKETDHLPSADSSHQASSLASSPASFPAACPASSPPASMEAFLEASPLMTGLVELEDQDIIHIADNSRSAAFFGKSRDELRLARASELGVPPAMIQHWIGNYWKAKDSGQPARFEYTPGTELTSFSVTVHYLGVNPETGRPRFIYMIEDLTSLRRSHLELEHRVRERTEELEAANRRLKEEMRERQILETERERLFNLPNHLLCILDDQSRFCSVNSGFSHILGYSSDDLIGRPIWEFIHPDDRDRTIEVERIGRTTVIHSFENRYRAKKGSYRWLRWTGTVIEGMNYGAAIDVTELKEIEADLKENLNARDEFLSIASHELKTPLTTLKLQAQMSMRGIERKDSRALEPERVRVLVEQTEKQVSRLGRLVDDMLDISRIRTGKLNLTPETVLLNPLVADLLERLQPAFDEAGTPCALLQDDLTLRGQWDRFRIEQVLTNLLTNAMRYGARKPITVQISKVGDFARISVRDQGLGVAQENHEKIFHRFERAISASEISGLGLGLYISREIVLAHRGRIWVESLGVSTGSNFCVELPLRSPSE